MAEGRNQRFLKRLGMAFDAFVLEYPAEADLPEPITGGVDAIIDHRDNNPFCIYGISGLKLTFLNVADAVKWRRWANREPISAQAQVFADKDTAEPAEGAPTEDPAPASSSSSSSDKDGEAAKKRRRVDSGDKAEKGGSTERKPSKR
eukprot:gb/GEZN01010282.1/.p1 GENE.gb/GEZN01010282.1/~~gb/GEZN01010282.1/.p1  ORF type:complete len:147 (-),score=26.31 gb/GEZN01010282.1/:278-718(-)